MSLIFRKTEKWEPVFWEGDFAKMVQFCRVAWIQPYILARLPSNLNESLLILKKQISSIFRNIQKGVPFSRVGTLQKLAFVMSPGDRLEFWTDRRHI